jgi:hypothetical protein
MHWGKRLPPNCPDSGRREADRAKDRCPDCLSCQVCSETRCNLCKKGRHECLAWDLGTGFTYGAYQEWKNKQQPEQGASH